MISVTPTGAALGATVGGVDLSKPLAASEFAQTLKALGEHGVLRFPGQQFCARHWFSGGRMRWSTVLLG